MTSRDVSYANSVAEMIVDRILNHTPEWMNEAACVPRTDLDFLDEADFDAAREVCATCPVRERCLRLGVETDNEEGIWGGEDIFDYLHPVDPE